MILKHRDTEVLRFEWLEPDGVHVTSVNEQPPRAVADSRGFAKCDSASDCGSQVSGPSSACRHRARQELEGRSRRG